jgi:hypothetical protein
MGSTAFGGIVSFSPVSQSVLPGEDAVYDITISESTLGGFDTVSLLLGSDDGLAMTVEYAQSFVDTTSLPPAAPTPFGVYASDLNFGGNNFGGWQAPLLIGTLTIDTTGLAEGTYSFGVSAAEETNRIGSGLSSLALGFESEGVEGSGRLNVVPEPATLAMLALGAAAAAFRRRMA